MAQLNFNGKWVLITGASSGLGMEMARYMAGHEKANLIIAARRKDRLEALKKEIEDSGNTKVEVLEADVSNPEAVERLFQQAVAVAPVFALVNNAGVTFYGQSGEDNLDFFDTIIEINFKAVMRLSCRFIAYFKEKGEGAILNVTSVAGLIPVPYQTVYSASKHAARVFTEGLAMEFLNSGITICNYAPGGIATEMIGNAGLDKKEGMNKFNMDAAVAARLAIKAFKKKKYIYVPGFSNKLMPFLVRLLPRRLVARIGEKIYKPPTT
ncbi:MAG: SDR family NAD(P)-dependent oxidoreductase [bacterium]|nr:SDR family NAD(P)-dependent oxidoreductase [bacterium]